MSTFILHDRLRRPLHGVLQRCLTILQRHFAGGVVLLYLPLKNTPKVFNWIQDRRHLLERLLKDFGGVLWIVIMLEYTFSAKPLETGSYLVSQYFGIPTGMHGAIYKCHPLNTLCTHALPCFSVGTVPSLW